MATCEFHLEPTDWLWATWREWLPLERPATPQFTMADGLRRFARVSKTNYRWNWNWERAEIPAAPSLEEASFWLAAIQAQIHTDQTTEQIAAGLANQEFDRILSTEQIQALHSSNSTYLHHMTTSLLGAFYTPVEIVAWIIDTIKVAGSYHQNNWRVLSITDGMRQHLLPYLSGEQRAEIRALLPQHLDLSEWPGDYYTPAPPAFYIAAMLGTDSDLLLKLVEGWADDQYSKAAWHDHYHHPQKIVLGLLSPELVERHMRRLKLRLNTPEYIRAWLAHTECSALDLACGSILAEEHKERAAELLQAFACAVGPAVAPHMLELMSNLRAPQVARGWLDAHPEDTITGLLPVADGRGKLADAAITLLRRFVRRGYAEAIAIALEALPAESSARLRLSLLEAGQEQRKPFDEQDTPKWLRDAIAVTPAKKPTPLPKWLHMVDLPPIVVGEQLLNEQQAGAVLGALQRSKRTTPDPLVSVVKQHAVPASLDMFAWSLFEQWLADGAPSKEQWALFALGLFGGDQTAIRLAPFVRLWPGESQHQRAVTGLECLRAIGSDTALMQISSIAQKVKFKGLQARAVECMEAIAKERGLSREQLEDRVIPDCELDERGERVFDFGARQFRFALGADMKPMIRDEQGKHRPDLPKPGAKDDAARAAQAVAEWKLLKKQVAEVAKIQALRLEQAMVTGRHWLPAEFERLFVQHPLMTHLVRTLIWGAYDSTGTLGGTFRVTEDQSYANSQDEPFALEGFAGVGIVHPLHMAQNELSAWGEILSDYTIVPPFAQLGRAVYTLEPGEREAKEITRFNHYAIPAASLVFGLEKLGWHRDSPADGGGFSSHFKPFEQADVTAVVHYDDGVAVGYIVDAPAQHIRYLAFVPGKLSAAWWPQHTNRLALSDVDPVVMSEALSDLITITAKLT